MSPESSPPLRVGIESGDGLVCRFGATVMVVAPGSDGTPR